MLGSQLSSSSRPHVNCFHSEPSEADPGRRVWGKYWESSWERLAASGEVGQEGRRSDKVRCEGSAEGNFGASPGVGWGPSGSLSPTRASPRGRSLHSHRERPCT